MNYPVPLPRAVCKGGWLRHIGVGMSGHFFSNDYGGDDHCWHDGCDAIWWMERDNA